MLSFLFLNWLLVVICILLSPLIIALLTMRLQKTVLVKHQASGLVKKGYFGFSWTYLLFGWLVPIIRGEVMIGVLHLILTAFTFGVFQLVMPFLYNKQYMTRLLTSGWQLCDEENIMAAARLKLGIVG